MCCDCDSQYAPRHGAEKSVGKKLKLSWENLFNVRESTEMLSTGMSEVFENENSFVYRKIVFGDVRAAIGTNVLRLGTVFCLSNLCI